MSTFLLRSALILTAPRLSEKEEKSRSTLELGIRSDIIKEVWNKEGVSDGDAPRKRESIWFTLFVV